MKTVYELALFYAKRNRIILAELSIQDEMRLQSLYNSHRYITGHSHRLAICAAVLEFWDCGAW